MTEFAERGGSRAEQGQPGKGCREERASGIYQVTRKTTGERFGFSGSQALQDRVGEGGAITGGPVCCSGGGLTRISQVCAGESRFRQVCAGEAGGSQRSRHCANQGRLGKTFPVDQNHPTSPQEHQHRARIIGCQSQTRYIESCTGEAGRSQSRCGETSRGETSRGETSRGETSRGETSRGETSPRKICSSKICSNKTCIRETCRGVGNVRRTARSRKGRSGQAGCKTSQPFAEGTFACCPRGDRGGRSTSEGIKVAEDASRSVGCPASDTKSGGQGT